MKKENNDDYFEKQKPSVLRSIGGLATFSTIIPLNIYTTIEEMAKMTWFWPVINAVVGILGAAIGYSLYHFLYLPPLLIATIVYGFFLIINGFNHLDGLMDLGDGAMVHGTPEKKIAIMRDPMTGVGGIATMFIVGTISIATLYTIISYNQFGLIIIAEMSAKIGLITCCVLSKSGSDGIGKYFVDYMNIPKYILGLAIAIIIAYLISPFMGVFGIIGGIFGGALAAFIARRHIKIANGDVLGASNELGRMFSLIAMLIPLMALIMA